MEMFLDTWVALSSPECGLVEPHLTVHVHLTHLFDILMRGREVKAVVITACVELFSSKTRAGVCMKLNMAV